MNIEENRKKLAFLMNIFCKGTILGWISGFFKSPNGIIVLKKNDTTYKSMLIGACEDYFNKCAQCICNGNDTYITNEVKNHINSMLKINVGNIYCWHDLLLLLANTCIAAINIMDKNVFLLPDKINPDYTETMKAADVYVSMLLSRVSLSEDRLIGCTPGHKSPLLKPHEKLLNIKML